MKFGEYIINESTALLVVDIQPAHEQFINFDIYEFTEYLNSYKGIINYIFNGPDMGYEDENELRDWLIDYGLDFNIADNINFIPKSYGWIREPMDGGADTNEIIKVLKYMMKNKIYDSRNINEEDYINLNISEEMIEFIEIGFGLPDIYKQMIKLPKSILVGGGKTECLLEMEITMDAIGIKYKRNKSFIY